MKHRNPFAVIVFSIITLGIYSIVWHVKTKNELNRRGASIPTAWLIIVPFVNIWWVWKYSEGVEKVTNESISAPLCFVLLFLLSVIGMAIVQSQFNNVSALSEPTSATTPVATPISAAQVDSVGVVPETNAPVVPPTDSNPEVQTLPPPAQPPSDTPSESSNDFTPPHV